MTGAEVVVRSVREAAAAAAAELLTAQPPEEGQQMLVTVPSISQLLELVGHTGFRDPVEIKVLVRRRDGVWQPYKWSIFDATDDEPVWHDGEFQPAR